MSRINDYLKVELVNMKFEEEYSMANQNYAEVAKAILSAIGGAENVNSAAHCATRLRLVLKDESKVDQAAIEKMDIVKGVFSTAGQF